MFSANNYDLEPFIVTLSNIFQGWEGITWELLGSRLHEAYESYGERLANGCVAQYPLNKKGEHKM